MGRFTRSLEDLLPRTGRLLKEDGSFLNQADRYLYQIGVHGNAWDNEQTGVESFSRIVDIENLPHVSVMGKIEAATDISFWVSMDGVNFYYCSDISSSITPSQPPAQTNTYPQTFHVFPTVGGRYIRLFSTNDVIATVTIAAKP